jgi:integrase
MAKSVPKPFKYRGRWRAQVTLKSGTRPHADFDDHASACEWICNMLSNSNTEHQAELGGPTQATLAQALKHYAALYSVNKGGVDSELNRINHYLAGAGMALLRKTKNENGQVALEHYEPKAQPQGWQEHNDSRRAKRSETYSAIEALARKRCSLINTADIRRLMSTMKSEGLSDSTIQKEIALLRHMFNVAAKEWQWKGFENPTADLKLGTSQRRFVFITKEQEAALWSAIAECDNPYFWPLIACALETTMRRGSLLAMRWDKTDLEGRIAQVPSKTGEINVPLSQHAVRVLSEMPRHPSGRVFPMTANAVEMAWDGVRVKAGVPELQFKDIRHLGATAYARRGLNAHQLKAILGHKTTFMAQVYVNLVAQDVLDAMDATAPVTPVTQVPPPAVGSAERIVQGRRAARLNDPVKKRLQPDGQGVKEPKTAIHEREQAHALRGASQDRLQASGGAGQQQAAVDAEPTWLGDNVVMLRPRTRAA